MSDNNNNATIITSEERSSPSLNPPVRIICHVCQKQFSQYTCPRCNSRYCSLHCYKSHSTRCTESFMRENVEGEMRQLQTDDDTKRKMLNILKRLHTVETDDMNEDEDDDQNENENGSVTNDIDTNSCAGLLHYVYDSTLTEETIQKILSGGEISFDDLTPEEKKIFRRALASGELSKLVEPWDPWWLKPSARMISISKDGTQRPQLVQPLDVPEASSHTQDDFPRGPETPLSHLSELSSVKPSSFLPLHLVDILFSYCFTLRLYNGDWQSDSIGSTMVVLSVSCVLNQSGKPESIRETMSYCLEQICSPAYKDMGGLDFGLGLIDDVISILSLGSPAIICSLCDLKRIIEAGERELKLEKRRKFRSSEIKSKLKLACKKIYYMMCWVNDQPAEGWLSLAEILRMDKNYACSKSVVNVESKGKGNAKNIIEEIT
ncbi:hypothetical protein ACFE04_002666 [Oxalis oulophora]